MRISAFLPCLVSALTILSAFAQETPEAFLKTIEDALKEKNPAKLEALVFSTGMTDEDKAMAKNAMKYFIKDPAIESITLQALPEDFQLSFVMRGRKIEVTAPPTGVVRIVYQKGPDGPGININTTTLPYAIVDGRYHLLGTRTTLLDWKGPEDKTIGYMVMGKGQDQARIDVKWNASGVNMERSSKAPSKSFMGQYIEQITVTSETDDADLKLTVLENGKPIFESKPLKGKGTLEYKRPQ